MEPEFLTFELVEHIHERSLKAFGGGAGTRDRGGFEGAVEQPKNLFYYTGGDLYEIAAAYAFPIAEAQAFVDGNKRTGIASALAFLKLNGVKTATATDELYDAMIGIAKRTVSRADLAALLRRLYSSAP